MRDGRTSHSQYLIRYSMRAQNFYTTVINAVEDPASSFIPNVMTPPLEVIERRFAATTAITLVNPAY